MKPLSEKIRSVPLSAALAVDLRVKELTAQGREVISFCVGEPDFPTDPAVCRAARAAIANGATRYTNAPGTMALRDAIAAELSARASAAYTAENIAVTTGAKYALFAAVSALADAGDEIILPAPYWTSYRHLITLAGAVPKIVPTTALNGWKLTPAALEAAVTPRARALILNNPNNPSGAVYTREELAALLRVAKKADIYVLADEIYDAYTFTPEPFCPAASIEKTYSENIITVNGFSKAFAMTGWRVGYVAAEKTVTEAISRLLSHTTGCPCAVSQQAALAALRAGRDYTERMRQSFQRRRDIFVSVAAGTDGLEFTVPDGTFYIMPYITGRLKERYGSAESFAAALLEQEGVAVVPCGDYGAADALRLSLTLPEARLREGAERLVRFARQ